MISTIVGSLIFIIRRRDMEVFPPSWKKLWKDWELQLMVMFSLIFQVVLIFFGNRRKYNPKISIKVIVWSTYLMADAIATLALGVLTNDLGDINENDGCKKNNVSLDANSELTAFWAPFLLLHLGGPDTITAYSLEDNELWLRHTFGLLSQTIVAIYIFLMAWTGSRLSFLAMTMILVGFLKYAERTWVLWSASSGQLRDSMLTSPEAGPNYARFMDEFSLKQAEGFNVRTDDVIQAQDSAEISVPDESSIADANELLTASELLERFKRLFVDLILNFRDRNFSQSLFKDMSQEKAFKVIEIELGFMYDLIYTKAKVAYTPAGFLRRLFYLSVVSTVLLVFSLAEKQKYRKVDICITFLLLVVAIVLEIYALFVLLKSDWTGLWLSNYSTKERRKKNADGRQIYKRNKPSTFLQVVKFIQQKKERRWSNLIGQCSVLSVSLQEKPATCLGIQKRLHIDEMLERVRYTTHKKVSDDLKKAFFENIKGKYEKLKRSSNDADVKKLCTWCGSRVLEERVLEERVLEKHGNPQLKWSINEDYDQKILTWQIATELCYHTDKSEFTERSKTNSNISTDISQYMLYLLVRYPFMLSVGIGLIRFRDTCAEAVEFFKARSSRLVSDQPDKKWSQACELLLNVNTQVPPKKVKGDGSKSLLFDACKLASELNKITVEKKWEMVSEIWVEILAYAVNQGRGNPHAQQLRRGGEFLTHIWILMAHFGITQQFQISEGHARAKLVVK